MSLALSLHTLFAVIWVGGMFFAYVCLRHSLGGLDAKAKTTLWAQVLGRFFRYVLSAIVILLGSGFYMIHALGGMKNVGPHVHIMVGLGIIMMLLALHVFFGPLRRLQRAVAAGDTADGQRRVAQIRIFVGANLLLGLIVVVVASGGKFLLG